MKKYLVNIFSCGLVCLIFCWAIFSYAQVSHVPEGKEGCRWSNVLSKWTCPKEDNSLNDMCERAIHDVSHSEEWARVIAVQDLGRVDCINIKSLKVLLKALSDRSYFVRMHTIRSLSYRYSDNEEVQNRITKMIGDDNKHVKIMAINTLGRIKQEIGYLHNQRHCVSEIAQLLFDIVDLDLQIATVQSIGVIGTENPRIHTALAELIDYNAQTPRAAVLRATIIDTLGRLPNVSNQIQRKIATRAIMDPLELNKIRALYALDNMSIRDDSVYVKILVSTTSFSPHVRTLADKILLKAKKQGILPFTYPVEQSFEFSSPQVPQTSQATQATQATQASHTSQAPQVPQATQVPQTRPSASLDSGDSVFFP